MAAKAITAFSFATPAATGAISGANIAVKVPTATDITALVATFTTTGASVAVGATAQVSGTTPNDFSSPVTYTVTASDLTTQDYTVTVTVSLVTVAEIAKLRRMVAEPTTTTYSDAAISAYIDKYPLLDEQGEEPSTLSGSTPPVREVNPNWIPTYDLNAAAADIWQEKAAAISQLYDFNADGGNYHRSQAYEQYMANARYYAARRMPSSARAHKSPNDRRTDALWIGNLPEPRDS
jgi:hypothetical protein